MPRRSAWNMDETTGDVLDVVGSRSFALNNGLQRVATTVEPSRPNHPAGGALTKQGSTLLALVSNDLTGLQTTARTFALWVKGVGNQVWIFRMYEPTNDTGNWGLYFLGGNMTLRMRRGDTNTNASVAFADDGAWHHFCGSFDGTTGRLFIDGILVASASPGGALDTDSSALQILETSLTTQTIDDLQLWDEAFTTGAAVTPLMLPVAADAGATAVLEGSVPMLTMDGSATVTAIADLSTSMPMLTMDAAATVTAAADLSGTIPMPVFDGIAIAQGEAAAILDTVVPVPVGGSGIYAVVSAEMRQQRILTKMFIDSNPVTISLTPNENVRKPSGGTALIPQTPRVPQVFRLIPMSHTEKPHQSSSASASADSGIQRRYDYTLLGEWDSTIGKYDSWETSDGQRLVVENLVSYNGYERKALIISYGGDPSHA